MTKMCYNIQGDIMKSITNFLRRQLITGVFLVTLIGSSVTMYLMTTNMNLALRILLIFFMLPLSIIFVGLFISISYRLVAKKDPKKWYTQTCIRSALKSTATVARVKIKVEGKKNIPKDQNYVVTANHKSYIDIPIHSYVFGDNLAFVSKPSIFNIPIAGKWMKLMNCVALDRESDREAAKAIMTAIKNIKKGHNYVIFLEGGRLDMTTSKMVDTKPGALKLATKPKVPIIPVSVDGNHKIAQRFPWRRTVVKVYIHKPIYHADYKDMQPNELADKIMRIVNWKITE